MQPVDSAVSPFIIVYIVPHPSEKRKEVTPMEERTKAILAALSGALAAPAEDYGMILLLGCTFILLDLATGLAKLI